MNRELVRAILIFLFFGTMFQGIALAVADEVNVAAILGCLWTFVALAFTSFLFGRIS